MIYSDPNFIPEDNEQDYEFTKHLPRWMIAFLKYKCSITLISLLEDREGGEIVFRIQKSILPETLKNNINNVFYLFQIDYNEIYGLEVFNHFVDTSNEVTRDFIIETGFNLYFIYLLY